MCCRIVRPRQPEAHRALAYCCTYIKDGIAHYVLWFEDGRIPDDQAVAAILTEKLEHRDVLWFENPAVVRSLPGLAHIHVFAR